MDYLDANVSYRNLSKRYRANRRRHNRQPSATITGRTQPAITTLPSRLIPVTLQNSDRASYYRRMARNLATSLPAWSPATDNMPDSVTSELRRASHYARH